jgi:flagellar hook protein FlgE
MSISASMNAGVLGLAANSTRLSTIADNLANAGTVGYKRADVQFEHERRLYRQTIRVLARELQRLEPTHVEAREALELLGETDRMGESGAA